MDDYELNKLAIIAREKEQAEKKKRQDYYRQQENLCSRLQILEKVHELIPEPNGTFTKRCPKCDEKLAIERLTDIVHDGVRMWDSGFRYFCKCGYEYGRVHYHLPRECSDFF